LPLFFFKITFIIKEKQKKVKQGAKGFGKGMHKSGSFGEL